MALDDLIGILRSKGLLQRVARPVSAEYELANVAHALDGLPVLFEKIDGYPDWRVITGLCSSRQHFALALGIPEEGLLLHLTHAIDNPQPPPLVSHAPFLEVQQDIIDLYQLPILKHLPQDGGAYVTSAVIVVNHPNYGRNVAYHRLLRIGEREFVVRLVENRGTHSAWIKSSRELPCAICIGVPLQVNLAAAISPAPGVDELSIANSLALTPLVRCRTVDLEVPAESELVLEGRITGRLFSEGPFPDLTGTMDAERQQPIIEIDAISHRKNPFYHALLPAGLEHKLLMGMPREPTIFAKVNEVTRCIDVSITPGGASWLHAVVKIEKKQPRDGRRAIEAAFRGHSSLKHVVIVDPDVDIRNPNEVEWAIATRFQADRDLIVMADQPGSSLDPSGIHVPGEKARTAKMGLDATIPWEVDATPYQRLGYDDVNAGDYIS